MFSSLRYRFSICSPSSDISDNTLGSWFSICSPPSDIGDLGSWLSICSPSYIGDNTLGS
jgi:hypothetical protein